MVNKQANPLSFLKSIYNNEFQWSVIKGFAAFCLGVYMSSAFIAYIHQQIWCSTSQGVRGRRNYASIADSLNHIVKFSG